MAETPTLPDFVALLPRGSLITPRKATKLWLAAVFAHDDWAVFGARHEEFRLALCEAVLPPLACVRAKQDRVWYDRFAQCFDILAKRIGAAEFDEGICHNTAEEVALHEIVRTAQRPSRSTHVASLPRRKCDSFDPIDILFRDTDVLWLYDMSLDGIEDPQSEANEFLRVGDVLQVDHWFDDFGDVTP